MEIVINGSPQEIAALAAELQERHDALFEDSIKKCVLSGLGERRVFCSQDPGLFPSGISNYGGGAG